MDWVFFTILAALLWSMVALIDKFVIGHEMKDPMTATVISGFCMLIFYALMSFIFDGIFMSFRLILMSVLAGMIYSSAVWVYYFSLKKGEVSKVAPALGTGPLFTVLLGFLFLKETFVPVKYLGIFFVLIGAFLLSFKMKRKHFNLDNYFLIALISSFMFAMRHVLVKYLTSLVDIWAIFVWMGVGSAIVAGVLLYFHHPRIRKRAKKGILHLTINAILSTVALLVFSLAISKGPVSLVMSLLGLQQLFVFVSATLLSKFHPKIIHEPLSRKILIQKALGSVLIIVGAALVL